jgi:exoribonuclease R
VGIHISDVAGLVLEDSAIDLEAQSRIASTYILKKFHKPMLPPQLNENICCLKPGADRLAVTLWVNIDSATGIIDYTSAKYEKTIINNKSALNYGKADNLLKST